MPGPVYYDLYDCGKLVGRYSGIELQKRFGWKCRPQVEVQRHGNPVPEAVPDCPSGYGNLGG